MTADSCIDLFYLATALRNQVVYIKPLSSKQLGDQQLDVLSEELGNKDEVPCPGALLRCQQTRTGDLTVEKSVVLSTEPLELHYYDHSH